MNYALLSKHRKYLMGFSALMIIICHNTLLIDAQPWKEIILFSRHFFQFGVDIFLLLSGLGGVFAYIKYNESVGQFYKKRYLRILPTYFVAILIWAVICFIVGWNPDIDFIKNFSLISFYIDGSGAEWYVSAIILLYLIFPVFYSIIKRNEKSFQVLMLLILGISFALSIVCPKSIINEIFIVRIPCYMLGIEIGFKLKNGKDRYYSPKIVGVFVLILFGLVLLNYCYNPINKWWLTRMLFTPFALCVSLYLSWRVDTRRNTSKLEVMVSSYGKYTLENYLVNEKVGTLLACIVYRVINRPVVTTIIENLLTVVMTIIAAIFLSKTIDLIEKKIRRKKYDMF